MPTLRVAERRDVDKDSHAAARQSRAIQQRRRKLVERADRAVDMMKFDLDRSDRGHFFRSALHRKLVTAQLAPFTHDLERKFGTTAPGKGRIGPAGDAEHRRSRGVHCNIVALRIERHGDSDRSGIQNGLQFFHPLCEPRIEQIDLALRRTPTHELADLDAQ